MMTGGDAEEKVTTGAGAPRMTDTSRTMANLLAFLRGLRSMGFGVGSDDEQVVLQVIGQVGFSSEAVCREAVAAAIVKNPVEYPLFMMAWQQFWLLLRRGGDSWVRRQTLMSSVLKQKSDRHRHPEVIWMGHQAQSLRKDEADAPDSFSVVMKGSESHEEALRQKDFADLTEMELQELLRFERQIRPVTHLSRKRIARPHGRELDLSATLRRAAGSGEPFQLVYGRRKRIPRPVVIICDVSGSMDPYSRVMLRFAHALCIQDWDIEVFVFSTRLTRVTRWLTIRDANDALKALTDNVLHLSGGTRLAETLAVFHREYARTVLFRGAVTLLVTDGFDTGSPEQLAAELSRLSRMSQRLIWLNPLAGHAGYTPTALGAKVLHNYADRMLPAHNFEALENAWSEVAALRGSRPPRRQWES
ncbi:VWA domain-containing protein [Alicyclobacillus mengziensis]|uniref:VWA domain-containing protein n=2 Tax=Alicyclobacillus mengziensis TaxID=2931921 RepID=A0A9X7VXP3_9BACL|nr:VWA domain-containing protein [Alicyclobacillus mengziensis]